MAGAVPPAAPVRAVRSDGGNCEAK